MVGIFTHIDVSYCWLKVRVHTQWNFTGRFHISVLNAFDLLRHLNSDKNLIMQNVLEKFEFFPIKCRVQRSLETFKHVSSDGPETRWNQKVQYDF